MTLTTGISMFGKMSVGVRRMATGPNMSNKIDITTKVYGLRNANRTIHIQGTLEPSGCAKGTRRAHLARTRPHYYCTPREKSKYGLKIRRRLVAGTELGNNSTASTTFPAHQMVMSPQLFRGPVFKGLGFALVLLAPWCSGIRRGKEVKRSNARHRDRLNVSGCV